MENQTEKLTSIILSFGLSKKEAVVYLAILSIGRGTVSQITRKANINRTTGYDILVHLAAQGLVSISGKEPKQEYIAKSPDSLLKLLDKRLKETEDDIEAAKAYIPELKSIHKVGDRPQVKFFEGKDGLRHVYEDTLASNTEDVIRAFATFEDMEASLGDFYEKYIKTRASKKILSRGIVPRTPEAIQRKKRDPEEYRELVLLPEKDASVFPEIDIYGNKVMIAYEREKLGIIIESAGVAYAMKKIFELAWERAKQLENEYERGAKSEPRV